MLDGKSKDALVPPAGAAHFHVINENFTFNIPGPFFIPHHHEHFKASPLALFTFKAEPLSNVEVISKQLKHEECII